MSSRKKKRQGHTAPAKSGVLENQLSLSSMWELDDHVRKLAINIVILILGREAEEGKDFRVFWNREKGKSQLMIEVRTDLRRLLLAEDGGGVKPILKYLGRESSQARKARVRVVVVPNNTLGPQTKKH